MSETRRRAVFIDRDGVINRMFYDAEFGTVDSPANPDQFSLIAGVGEAIAEINRMGLLAIVVSNQPGIAKGKLTLRLLEAIEEKMVRDIRTAGGRLDAIYNCLHHPEAEVAQYRKVCECRKPRPGLILEAAREQAVELRGSYLLGDGVTDISAGRAAGLITVFVNSRKCYNCASLIEHEVWPDYLVGNLTEAASLISALESGDAEAARSYRLTCVS
ncbi:MAG TPA: HAD-IIIA family hydrolase [Blastocatellia bacterium]|nr:HAD-IIIA family hydrolase [Blastocatellia bacterium]